MKTIINASNHSKFEETNRKDVLMLKLENIPNKSVLEALPIQFFSASFQFDLKNQLCNKNQSKWLRESVELVTWFTVILCARLNSGFDNSATGGQNIRRKLTSAEIKRNVESAIFL